MNSDYEPSKPVKIEAINGDTVHKICSGQVVLSLAVAVKELVENALDAGATTIDVRFKNYGIDLIEVSDNGSGVTKENFAALTLKHHTSKLTEYADLLGVSSYGFRGEALSSLCALADLTITTRHQSSTHANKVEYDHKGHIRKKTPCSRQVGTTVSLSNLFHSLPVRQKEFHKNVKREFNKMTQLLYAYCLISLGVKITCSNQTSLNSKSLIVATQGSKSYKDNIASIFGLKQQLTLLEIKPEYATNIKDNIFKGLSQKVEDNEESVNVEDVEIDLSEDSNDAETKDDSIMTYPKSQGYKNLVDPVEFQGFISSCAHGNGRSSADRQFYYVNSRPCEPVKVIKLINEIYKQFNPNQYPFVFLNVNLERTSVDVNLTPDKRKVFLIKEKLVLDVLKQSLIKLFEDIPRTLKVETHLSGKTSSNVKPDINIAQPRIYNSFIQKFGHRSSSIGNTSSMNDDASKILELKRKSTSMLDFISAKVMKKPTEELTATKVYTDDHVVGKDVFTEDLNVHDKYDSNNTIKSEKLQDRDIIYLESTDELPSTQIRYLNDVVIEKSHKISCKTRPKASKVKSCPQTSEIERNNKSELFTDKEDLGKNNRKVVSMKTSVEHIKGLSQIYKTQRANFAPKRIKFISTINPVFNQKCEEELSKEISKDSFREMIIIGQFNLGFIITRLEDDLFIIDQHASDEIYNFETLQKTTELTNQKLVIPQQLELTGVNEEILIDNLAVFKKNGFTFKINSNALPTKRVKLLTIPMSKNWIFGKDDIEELLFMLRESPSENCRPSRVRKMFASRACRKSVMIGTALSKADMRKLVDHMAKIDKPWNCPHGRPTIRHLVNLAMVNTKSLDADPNRYHMFKSINES